MKKRISIAKEKTGELMLHTYNAAQDASSCCEIYDDVFNLGLQHGQHADIYFDLVNGTFEVEKQRDNGWYMAKSKLNGKLYFLRFTDGRWYGKGGDTANPKRHIISDTRIPSECILQELNP